MLGNKNNDQGYKPTIVLLSFEVLGAKSCEWKITFYVIRQISLTKDLQQVVIPH